MASDTISKQDFSEMKRQAELKAIELCSRAEENNQPEVKVTHSEKNSGKKKKSKTNVLDLDLSAVLGIESDTIIVLVVIALLLQESDNMMLVLALLYIMA